MRTLSSGAATAADRLYADIIRLAVFEFTGLTLYLCDRIFGTAGSECVFDSNLYEPLILNWSTIRLGRIDPVTYEVEASEAEITIDNSVPVGGYDRFTEIFADKPPHYVTVTIYELFSDATTSGDEIKTFKGKIEDFPSMGPDSVRVRISGIELDITNKFEHTIINTTDYAGADPDDVGKMLPIVYGSAKRVPFRALDAGAVTTLTDVLTKGGTTVYVSDTSEFPASGTIVVGTEEIEYTGKTATTFTGLTRPDSYGWPIGTIVYELQDEYIFGIDHPVKAIDVVYIKDKAGIEVVYDTDYWTGYTGQPGDEHGSYPGMAVLSCVDRPLYWQNIYVDALDHDHDDTFATTAVSVERYPTGNAAVNVVNPTNAYNGNEEDFALIYDAGFASSLSLTFPSTDLGTIGEQYVWVIAQVPNGAHTVDIRGDGGDDIYTPNTITGGAGTPQTYRFYTTNAEWNQGIKFQCGAGEQCQVYEAWKATYYIPDITGAVSTEALSLTGNTVANWLFGDVVSADVQGFPLMLEDGLVAVGLWPLDETAGVTATDESGNGNDGTVEGTDAGDHWATDDVVVKGYDFPGVDQRIDFGNAAPIDNLFNNQNCWFSIWANPDSLSNYQRLFDKKQDVSNNIWVAMTGAGRLRINIQKNVTTSTSNVGEVLAFEIGVLKNYFIWFDITGDELVHVWINSEYWGEHSMADIILAEGTDLSNTGNLSIGATNLGAANTMFDGLQSKFFCGTGDPSQEFIDLLYSMPPLTPGDLIERPDHILSHILINRCGRSATEIDMTSYNAAGTYYNAQSYVLAFALLERPNVRMLLQQIAYQSKSLQFWEGGLHHLVHIPAADTTDKYIYDHNIDAGQISVSYTPRSQLINTLSATYNKYWAGYDNETESERGIVISTDAASVAIYGTLEGDRVSFPMIPGSTQAQAVLDWIKGDLANPRLIIEFSGGYSLTELERGDVISFVFDADGILDDSLLGLVTSGDTDKFRIVDMTRRPDAAIQIECVKI